MALVSGAPRDIWKGCIVPQLLSPITLARLGSCNKVLHGWLSDSPLVAEYRSYTPNQGLKTAAAVGNRELVDLFISKGATDWDSALYAASEGGHRDLVDLFIARGATNWDWALYPASRGGHRELVDLFIDNGATGWDSALRGASRGGHLDLVDLFIDKGATDWNGALVAASRGGHLDLVEYLKEQRSKSEKRRRLGENECL